MKLSSISLLCTIILSAPAIAETAIVFPKLSASVSQAYGDESISNLDAFAALLSNSEELSTAEKLERVNTFVTDNIRYGVDQDIFAQNDYWATPGETFGLVNGDCEDHAIVKYVALLHMGIDFDKLRLIYLKARIGRSRIPEAHMVVAYYETPEADPLVLDSIRADIVPLSQRPDLRAVFSFNSKGLWKNGETKPLKSSTKHLTRWLDVIERMKNEGITIG